MGQQHLGILYLLPPSSILPLKNFPPPSKSGVSVAAWQMISETCSDIENHPPPTNPQSPQELAKPEQAQTVASALVALDPKERQLPKTTRGRLNGLRSHVKVVASIAPSKAKDILVKDKRRLPATKSFPDPSRRALVARSLKG
jgi:hypothetical protein